MHEARLRAAIDLIVPRCAEQAYLPTRSNDRNRGAVTLPGDQQRPYAVLPTSPV
jgi:hypothetical protein